MHQAPTVYPATVPVVLGPVGRKETRADLANVVGPGHMGLVGLRGPQESLPGIVLATVGCRD